MRSVAKSVVAVSGFLIFVTGCSSEGNPGVIPASTDAASTHEAIENPAGIKEKATAKKSKAANSLPPQPPK